MARGFLYAMSILAIIVSVLFWPLSPFLAVIVLVAGLSIRANGLIVACLSLSIIAAPILLPLLMTMLM